MKWANVLFEAKSIVNIGDYLQIAAVDMIYEKMGIEKDSIVYIDTRELATYNGDYVVLPIAMPMIDWVEGGIVNRFSDRIIPVFLSFTLVYDKLSKEEVSF